MQTFITNKQVHQLSLVQELEAGNLIPNSILLDVVGKTHIDFDDTVDLTAVNTIVEAHDPTIGEAKEAADFNQLVTYRNDLASQYQTAVTRLNAIVTNGPTYTAAQTRDAVVDMAKIQLALLRLVKRTLT